MTNFTGRLPTISRGSGASVLPATSLNQRQRIREAFIKQRILTAGVALPLLLLLIIKGDFLLFSAFVALLGFVGLFEYCRMTLPGRVNVSIAVSLAGILFPVVFYSRSAVFTIFAVTLLVLGIACYTLFSFKDIRVAASEASLLFFGLIYIPYLLGYLVLLRGHPLGSKWILLIMLIVMSGDSAAYFIGCRFGRHRLYPEVSPKKSIEGSLGGLAGSLAGGLAAKFLFFQELTLADAVIAPLLIGAFSQVGDLFESMIKRSCDVKDSGNIFPGHGGVMDRLDSIIFAAPATYYYASYLAGRIIF